MFASVVISGSVFGSLFSAAVFVNVAGQAIEDYVAVTERLSSEPGIAGFELNISCPNVSKGGISFGTQPENVTEITSAVKSAAGDKTLMVKLSPSVTDISVIARAAVKGRALPEMPISPKWAPGPRWMTSVPRRESATPPVRIR